MLISSDFSRSRALTRESICLVLSRSVVSKGKRVSEKRQSVWSRKWVLMAWVKLAGVGADLPLLQPEARETVRRHRTVGRVEAGFLRTIFIASPMVYLLDAAT